MIFGWAQSFVMSNGQGTLAFLLWNSRWTCLGHTPFRTHIPYQNSFKPKKLLHDQSLSNDNYQVRSSLATPSTIVTTATSSCINNIAWNQWQQQQLITTTNATTHQKTGWNTTSNNGPLGLDIGWCREHSWATPTRLDCSGMVAMDCAF